MEQGKLLFDRVPYRMCRGGVVYMKILANSEFLQYCGRIDYSDPEAPVFVFPSTYVEFCFTGQKLTAFFASRKCDTDHYYLGYIADGKQGKLLLAPDGAVTAYDIPLDSEKEKHRVMLFKRQDGCHTLTFRGLETDEDAVFSEPPALPRRKIEVFGDSVSCGAVSEALEYTGKPDPEQNGEYSNSYYSYAWMTARNLRAQLHNTSQGGIALLDGTGWFREPEAIGMERMYDKIQYNPDLGEPKPWEFFRYTPHVVIVAIGQNDSHPEDYMAADFYGEKAQNWKNHYRDFILNLQQQYPRAVFVLCTTILHHSAKWDQAIGAVCSELQDGRIFHFIYNRNGRGTPGHARIAEAEEMSFELSRFIMAMGDEIWTA